MSSEPSVSNDSCTGRASNEIIMKYEARASRRRPDQRSNQSQTADSNGRTDQGVPLSKLSESEILERLPRAKNWDRHGDMLVRTWQFPSFRRALEFVNHVAALLEKTDHYPDLIVNYRTVRIEMSTHDVGGLTERDFSLIAELNEIPTDR